MVLTHNKPKHRCDARFVPECPRRNGHEMRVRANQDPEKARGCGRGGPWSSISGVSEGERRDFSAAEMRRRRAALGRELDRHGTPYALVYGANRSGSAVSWLTGWPVTREAVVMVAPQAEDDVLLVSFF